MAANAVAKKTTVQTFGEYFMQKSKNLAGLIPRHLTPERVWKIAISAVMRNPTLLQCKPETVWFQVAQAASLGLEVNLLGSAYLIPFKNNKVGGMDCQLIVGYQGLIDLARRSGNIDSIEARIVYEKDDFAIEYGLNPVLSHKPHLDGDPGRMRLVYAVASLKDGGRQVETMTKSEVDAIRSRSRAKNDGPWVTDYNEMARKTVIRRLAKYLPKSIELSQALALDDAGDAGEPQLAGLDVESMENYAEAQVIPDEESETDKLKSDMKSRKKDDAVSPNVEVAADLRPDFLKYYSKLSIMYDERGAEIDEMFRISGIDKSLIDITKEETDPKIMAEVIRIAAEF